MGKPGGYSVNRETLRQLIEKAGYNTKSTKSMLAFAKKARTSLTTLKRLLAGGAAHRETLEGIAEALNLTDDWEALRDYPPLPSEDEEPTISVIILVPDDTAKATHVIRKLRSSIASLGITARIEIAKVEKGSLLITVLVNDYTLWALLLAFSRMLFRDLHFSQVTFPDSAIPSLLTIQYSPPGPIMGRLRFAFPELRFHRSSDGTISARRKRLPKPATKTTILHE